MAILLYPDPADGPYSAPTAISGIRTAESFEGSSASAAELIISYVTEPSLAIEKTWRSDQTGEWHASGNWSGGGAPDGDPIEEVAIFGDAISKSQVVYTLDPVTVKGMQFANSNAYVIAGAGAINLEDTSEPAAAVAVVIGDHEIQAKVNLLNDVNMTLGTNTSLTLNNQLDLGGRTLTKTGSGTLTVNNNLVSGSGGTVDCQGGNCTGTGTIGGNLTNSGGVVAPGRWPERRLFPNRRAWYYPV